MKLSLQELNYRVLSIRMSNNNNNTQFGSAQEYSISKVCFLCPYEDDVNEQFKLCCIQTDNGDHDRC